VGERLLVLEVGGALVLVPAGWAWLGARAPAPAPGDPPSR
jgi:hypothetical protein